MNRNDFQLLAKMRIAEARALLEKEHYGGCYYLAGVAIECALKACIAKKSRRHDFPNKNVVNSCYTHNLEALVKSAGLGIDLDKEAMSNNAFRDNWSVVKDWNIEDARYRHSIPELTARDYYSAVVSKKHGILPWLKKRW